MAESNFEQGNDEAPAPPLFTLDLGENGGYFAPVSIDEIDAWVRHEIGFWSWASNVGSGSSKHLLDRAQNALREASDVTQRVRNYTDRSSERQRAEQINRISGLLREVYEMWRLPHSSTPLAQRVDQRKSEPNRAIAYLFPYLAHGDQARAQFDGRDLESWRGFAEGLVDRFGFEREDFSSLRAQAAALDDLRRRAERRLTRMKLVAGRLQRDFNAVAADIRDASVHQNAMFSELVENSKQAHAAALGEHKEKMDALEKTFNEKMALRGPVDYWQRKETEHTTKSGRWMRWAFGSMAALAMVIGLISLWAFWGLNVDNRPDAWKIAILGIVGVIGVWAVRLIVRMYLSHSHLATDAAERVTMVKTYLALLEGNNMPTDDDRKLVLAPLFRPAADGLVKDEGIPHPLIDMLTRQK